MRRWCTPLADNPLGKKPPPTSECLGTADYGEVKPAYATLRRGETRLRLSGKRYADFGEVKEKSAFLFLKNSAFGRNVLAVVACRDWVLSWEFIVSPDNLIRSSSLSIQDYGRLEVGTYQGRILIPLNWGEHSAFFILASADSFGCLVIY